MFERGRNASIQKVVFSAIDDDIIARDDEMCFKDWLMLNGAMQSALTSKDITQLEHLLIFKGDHTPSKLAFWAAQHNHPALETFAQLDGFVNSKTLTLTEGSEPSAARQRTRGTLLHSLLHSGGVKTLMMLLQNGSKPINPRLIESDGVSVLELMLTHRDCREWALQHGCFKFPVRDLNAAHGSEVKCYRLDGICLVHTSDTSKVVTAVDISSGVPVVLKFMKFKEHYNSEMVARAARVEGVVKIIKTFELSMDELKQTNEYLTLCNEINSTGEAKLHEFESFIDGSDDKKCNVLVMPRGSRDLMDVLSHDRIAGHEESLVCEYGRGAAVSLGALAQRRLSHGDIKLLNIMQFATDTTDSSSQLTLKLIDMDSSTEYGKPAGMKFSTACIPPELARLVLQYKDACRKEPSDDWPHWEQWRREQAALSQCTELLSSVTFDVWQFGVLLFCLCNQDGGSLFHANAADNLVNAEDLVKVAFGWDICRMDTLAQARIPPEWHQAKDLILWCLQGNPDRRPQSFDEILQHPFFVQDCVPAAAVRTVADHEQGPQADSATSLYGAIRTNDAAAVKDLFRHGAVHVNTPLGLQVELQHCSIETLQDKAEEVGIKTKDKGNDSKDAIISQILGRYTARAARPDCSLHLVARLGRADIAMSLLDEVPQHSSITGVMRNLVERHVLHNILDRRAEHGLTPYMIACESGCLEVAKMLVNRGCDTTLRNDNGSTGFEMALDVQQRCDECHRCKHCEMVDCLQQLAQDHEGLDQEMTRGIPSYSPVRHPSVSVASEGSRLACPLGHSKGSRHIFLSYRRVDIHAARLVANSLEHKGYTVFLDVGRSGLSAGHFQKQLEDVLKNTPVVVALCTATQNSSGNLEFKRIHNKKDFVRLEIRAALHMRKMLIPVHFAQSPGTPAFDVGAMMRGLPQDIKGLADQNFLLLHHEYLEQGITKIDEWIDKAARAGDLADKISFDGDLTEDGQWRDEDGHIQNSADPVLAPAPAVTVDPSTTRLTQEIERLRSELNAKDDRLNLKEDQLAAKKDQLDAKIAELSAKNTELALMKGELARHSTSASDPVEGVPPS